MKRLLRTPGSHRRPQQTYRAERDAALHPYGSPKLFQARLLPTLLAAIVSYAQQSSQAPAAREAGSVDFQIVDVVTGYAIGSANVRWDMAGPSLGSELSHSGPASQDGRFVRQLSPGEYVFEISAPGYETMRTHDNVAPGSVARAEINLHPVSPPEELSEARVKSKLREGLELVQGYVVDAVTHRPMSGVRVTLEQSGASTTTGNDGYFQLYAPAVSTAHLSRPEDFPKADTLTATAPGYKTYAITGLLYDPGSSSVVRIAMTPGTGTTSEDVLPRALRPAGTPLQEAPQATSPIPEDLERWLSVPAAAVRIGAGPSEGLSPPVVPSGIGGFSPWVVTVPASIRVGSNCTARQYGCTTTNMYSLEDYVKYGLGYEWISSWNSNSLEAGAVGYRTFGAYYVAHPWCPPQAQTVQWFMTSATAPPVRSSIPTDQPHQSPPLSRQRPE